jgi:hypothetical protein
MSISKQIGAAVARDPVIGDLIANPAAPLGPAGVVPATASSAAPVPTAPVGDAASAGDSGKAGASPANPSAAWAAVSATAEAKEAPSPAPRRWSRASTIWLLVGLSLVPGMVAAVDRAWWSGLPAAVRLGSYAMSGVLVAVLCALILKSEPPAGRPQD